MDGRPASVREQAEFYADHVRSCPDVARIDGIQAEFSEAAVRAEIDPKDPKVRSGAWLLLHEAGSVLLDHFQGAEGEDMVTGILDSFSHVLGYYEAHYR